MNFYEYHEKIQELVEGVEFESLAGKAGEISASVGRLRLQLVTEGLSLSTQDRAIIAFELECLDEAIGHALNYERAKRIGI